MNCFKLLPALFLTLPACVLDKDLGDTTGGTTAASASSTGGTDPGDTTNATMTTGDLDMTDMTATVGEPTALCPNSDDGAFTCTVPPPPITCNSGWCGGLLDTFDDDGCPRATCRDDEPCPAGQVCMNHEDWGTCTSSGSFCETLLGVCECFENADFCNPAAYCVPAEIGPPADCFAITDAAECLAAGCSEASTMIPVVLDGDTCVCNEPETACLWFTEGIPGSEGSPGAYYEIASDRVVVFPGAWNDMPMGWSNCEDSNGPPACACADTCK